MLRRIFALLLLAGSFSGCAALNAALADSPPEEPAVEVPKTTPDQAYDAGVLDLERGDDGAARREWDRCLATSAPDSPARVDCLVALEQLAMQTASTAPDGNK